MCMYYKNKICQEMTNIDFFQWNTDSYTTDNWKSMTLHFLRNNQANYPGE